MDGLTMGGQMTHPWASCMVHCTVQCTETTHGHHPWPPWPPWASCMVLCRTMQDDHGGHGGHPGQGCHFLVDLTGMSMGDPSEGV